MLPSVYPDNKLTHAHILFFTIALTFVSLGLYIVKYAGIVYAIGAVFLGLVAGIPLFKWFQSVGLDVSHLSDSTMPVRERVFLDIHFLEVVSTVSLVVLIMILVAWWPVRKISHLDPTMALRGRAIT